MIFALSGHVASLQNSACTAALPEKIYCLPVSRIARAEEEVCYYWLVCQEVRLACRAVSASAATLAPSQTQVPKLDKLPATHLPVTYTDGSLCAGGYPFVRNLSPCFSVDAEAAPSAGIVLSLEASDGRPTSAEETTLGQLACSRCGSQPSTYS